MIIAMSKLRLMGPRERLPEVLRLLQDLNLLHLASPQVAANEPIAPAALSGADERQRRHLRSLLADINAALIDLHLPGAAAAGRLSPPSIVDLSRWARLARRTRREAERLKLQLAGLDEEHALILKYQQFFSAFRALLEAETHWPNATA